MKKLYVLYQAWIAKIEYIFLYGKILLFLEWFHHEDFEILEKNKLYNFIARKYLKMMDHSQSLLESIDCDPDYVKELEDALSS